MITWHYKTFYEVNYITCCECFRYPFHLHQNVYSHVCACIQCKYDKMETNYWTNKVLKAWLFVLLGMHPFATELLYQTIRYYNIVTHGQLKF